MLQNRVASLMRNLDNFHSYLFVGKELSRFGFEVKTTPDEYLGCSIERVKEYQEWRLTRLASDAEELQKEDKKRWEELFEPPLYRIGIGQEDFTNHWHITASREKDGRTIWTDFGHAYPRDLTFDHIMASYRRGMEVRIFHGDAISAGDKEYRYGGLTDDLPGEPRGIGNNGLPQVKITKGGAVHFDMKI